jgi:hypothetical protein
MLVNFEEFMNIKNLVLKKIGEFFEISLEVLYDEPIPHANKSLARVRQKEKADKQIKLFNKLKRIMPGRLNEYIRKRVFVSDRKFDVKPELSEKSKDYILRSVEQDIIEIEKITGWDLKMWRE